jgi:two-component system NtrC family sensor kinase
MEVFYFITAFILLNRLYKSVKYTAIWMKWKPVLIYLQIGIWVAYLVCKACFHDNDGINSILGASLLLGVVFWVDKQEDFKNFGFYLKAHYPLIAIGYLSGLIILIKHSFYNDYEGWFMGAVIGGFFWIFGIWATSKKQREELRMASARNQELDRLVAERTAALTMQKEELEKALEQLKVTQQQLIQSEKLASLGELTAGIAHEIQNPLNFVNNFSDVSMELIDEMEQELAKGDTEEAMAIATDIKQNLEKIRHHGKRADGIVKGMLQHSRASSNTKEAADINKLADEYFRLAYHGLRAKDKSFNAELETHFAEGLPMVNMVPQDVGRVLLNLFNNAFYAVQQKHKELGDTFKPVVKVTTALKGKFLEITVTDNGTGMPDEIKEKILQPFFTTKPTGEGTGLGLSLSYDIIVKGHGGKIDIASKEGEGSEFIIKLPVQ